MLDEGLLSQLRGGGGSSLVIGDTKLRAVREEGENGVEVVMSWVDACPTSRPSNYRGYEWKITTTWKDCKGSLAGRTSK